jgi:uncharacterized protein (DUF302 family)
MAEKTDLGIRKQVELPYDRALERTREALQKEGFGVLTEIDMKAKMKEKLNVDIKRYMILGACNPPLAYRALQAEPEIGLLLPCNVIVYEAGGQSSIVSAANPESILELAGDNPELKKVAAEARERLQRAIDAL